MKKGLREKKGNLLDWECEYWWENQIKRQRELRAKCVNLHNMK